MKKGLPLVTLRLRKPLMAIGLGASLLVPALVGAAPDPKKGPDIFKARGCIGCHKIGKDGGNMGPDLTHVGKTSTAANIRKKIENPKAGMPNSLMPAAKDLGMKPAEIADVTAYLASLK